ncbi:MULTISPECIES: MobH family relaxase [unclassified Modicisalibacter]|uniref:MobH family relaxase n=1 Tax=unclassified Modicisalibacter TaxID=2679913 RepID=UPI001CCFAFB8|nr:MULTISPECIES: MobH family relaxase [unclassified Modicisalibacter]MBZ9559116.1 helicase/relaxase domain-containing protein [Modicisalibacter sp. R2A 31.J]MBZ9576773.1 helicase/relaxase domain-containing protein [Modicisalibacter sp. MOD 31.J]
MFQRLFSRPAAPPIAAGYQAPRSGEALLATPRRQQMVKLIWDTTSLTESVFDAYLLAPIRRYAELVQLLPASESHHHAYAGGMLDHALETACYGLKLRQRHLLPPGAKAEDQSSAGELWSAAIIYGALMHDAAKVLVDIEIHLDDGTEWRLWHGAIPRPYRVRYRPGRDYHLHGVINPLLCEQVLGPRALDWLMTQPQLFALLMYTISGHTERGGIIAELVHQADRASVAKALGGDPIQALAAPSESIQRKLADGLRYLVREQFKINQKGGVGWLTDDALWLVSPRAVNELKTHLYSQGIKSIPADLNRLYGELQAHGLIEEVGEGKSVWKIEIQDGDWQQVFNMIKVSPTLVWGVEGRPASFTGTVTVQGASADESSNVQAPDDNLESNIQLSQEKVGGEDHSGMAASGKLDEDIMSLFPEKMDEGDTKTRTTTHSENDHGFSSNMLDSMENAEADKGAGPPLEEVGEYKEDPSQDACYGVQFWKWLKTGLADHSILINDTQAPVHVVDGTYFLVSPGIFKSFSRLVLDDESQWKFVQKRFQKLGVHVRTQGKNIHTVIVEGPKKSRELQGYLIKDPKCLGQKVPADNWALALKKKEEG